MNRESITSLRFSPEDYELARIFQSLQPTVVYGSRGFPNVAQYRHAVAELEEADTWDRPRILAAAQRDWHARGQNGCLFARLAAIGADQLQWDYLVVGDGQQVPRAEIISEMVQRHASQEGVEILSLLVPAIVSADQVLKFVRELVDSSAFWLERDERSEGLAIVHLRYPVVAASTDVQAWVMGFGPFAWMPNTRRGPYFELVIRTREKNVWIFHRLNQDRDIAHLADIPLKMSTRYWEHRWQSTRRRTRMILGKEPDSYSAAKCTLVVPLSEMMQE